MWRDVMIALSSLTSTLEVSGQFQVMVNLPGCYGDEKNKVLPPVNEI